MTIVILPPEGLFPPELHTVLPLALVVVVVMLVVAIAMIIVLILICAIIPVIIVWTSNRKYNELRYTYRYITYGIV